MRGDGSLILRGRVYYARFYDHGREIRESLLTTDADVARRRFVALRKQLARGVYVDPGQRRVRVDELLDDLVGHLETRGIASLPKMKSTLKAVRAELGHRPAHLLDTATIERAQAAWLKAGAAAATVNRRCELLRQALRIGARRRPPKVVQPPEVPLLRVENARQGFLAQDDVERLVAALEDEDVRDFVEWLGWTGMRPGEARQLTWPMVDLGVGALTVAPTVAKTRRGRVLALVGPLLEIVRRRQARRRLGCELVFHRVSKGRPGAPIQDIRRAFRAALKAAKLPLTVRPYDLRRSALRNLIRSGTHETVAMAISGHRTRSTFDRYNITSVEDVAAAIRRVAGIAEPAKKEA